MSDIVKFDVSLPLDRLADHLAYKNKRKGELIKFLAELLIDVSNVGRHLKKDQKYQIVYSPTFYGHGKCDLGQNPSEIVFRFLKIVKEYGWEFPKFVHILMKFKKTIESYKWESQEVMVIPSLSDFDKKHGEHVKELEGYIRSQLSTPSFPKRSWLFIRDCLLLPSLLAFPILSFLLFLFEPTILSYLFSLIQPGLKVFVLILISFFISYTMLWIVEKKN